MSNEMVLLRSTFGNEADARAAARRLIEKRVAACAHVHAITSFYRWDGVVQDAAEWLVEARTTPDDLDACWDGLLDGHPYENPLVEVIGTSQVPARYAQWAARCTKR